MLHTVHIVMSRPDSFYVTLQTEPAVSVRADPDFTAAESSDAAALQQNAEQPSEDHPPEFNAAARREHMDEAAAIRQSLQVGLRLPLSVVFLMILRCPDQKSTYNHQTKPVNGFFVHHR